MEKRPAACLKGLKLDGGWTVGNIVKRPKSSTGGKFSIGYEATHESGKVGYLKALDFSSAMASPDPSRALFALTKAYNFERDLLIKCGSKGMSKVVIPLDYGTTHLNGFGNISPVCYIIFEMAKRDIRHHADLLDRFDMAWCFRSMHHISIGLHQLHQAGIVHQDLKPSNVLYFGDNNHKLTDLGRAFCKDMTSEVDDYQLPGDPAYAPLEQFYRFRLPNDLDSRMSADLYLMGSMLFYFFLNTSVTATIHASFKAHAGPNLSGADFLADLPFFQEAFYRIVEEFRNSIIMDRMGFADQIVQIVTELCNPDPSKRGNPRTLQSQGRKYSVLRYISRFDLLARQAEKYFK